MSCDDCKFKAFCKHFANVMELQEQAGDWRSNIFGLPDEITILISCPHYQKGDEAS